MTGSDSEQERQPDDPFGLEGQVLMGMYRVGRPLHRSGMGVVYLGENTTLGTPIVLKIPDPRSVHEDGFLERFHREIQSLVDLQHPHVVRIQAQGVHEGIPFIVLDHLDGGSLASRLVEQGQCSLDEVRAWAGVIADTLDYIHTQGVVHRDVKPSNILFDRDGRPILSDFGLAHFAPPDAGRLTETGVAVGSPHYMAPEQALGGEVTAKTDQYGLAATLYEALAGQPPFPTGALIHILVQKTKDPPPDIRTLVPDLPPEVGDAIMTALAMDPEDRHPSCRHFADLLGAPGNPADSSTQLRLEAVRQEAASRRRSRVPLLLLALVGIAGAAWAAWSWRGNETQPPGRGDPPLGAQAPSAPGEYAPRWLRPAAGAQLREPKVQAAIQVPGLPPRARVRMRLTGAVATEWIDARRDEDARLFEQSVDREGLVAIEVRIEGEGVRTTTMRREVVFDWTAPSIEVTSPTERDAESAEPVIGVQGRVTDANPCVVELNGEPVPTNADGAFLHHLQLPADAPATFSVSARDMAGNESLVGPYRVSLSRPDRRYTIDVRSPAERAFIATSSVSIEGRVEPVDEGTPREVFINGRPVPVTDGAFRSSLEVEADGPLAIRVRIQGAGLTPADVTRTVTIDGTPPVIELDPPTTEGSGPDVEIRGHVQDQNPKEVLVDGTAYPVEDDGSFLLRLAWRPDREIVLVAIDQAGNKSLPVSREPGRDEEVRIVLQSPRDGETLPVVESGLVAVAATVRNLRADDRVLVNGDRPLRDGNEILFTHRVEGRGPHAIAITVERADVTIAEERASFRLDPDIPYHPLRLSAAAGEPPLEGLAAAQASAAARGKHVLAYVRRPGGSVWDHRVERDVFADPDLLAALRERYVPVVVEAELEALRRYRIAQTPSVVLMLPDGTPYARLHRGGLRPEHVLARVATAYATGQAVASIRAEDAPPPTDPDLTALLTALAQARFLTDPAHESLVSLALERDPEGALGVVGALAAERAENELRALRERDAPVREVLAYLNTAEDLRGIYYVETLFGVVESLRAAGAVSDAKTLVARIPLDPTWESDAAVRARYKAVLDRIQSAAGD